MSSIGSKVNGLLARGLGIRIVRERTVHGDKTAREIFAGRNLVESSDGYFYLDPMPSSQELDHYYANAYWGSRGGKEYGASARDLLHYHLLRSHAAELFDGGSKSMLNFGAGHGGISNLFWFDGFDVINIEPSAVPPSYETRWTHHRRLDAVPDRSVDLIYGSHSLEHVNDLDAMKREVARILKPRGLLFWEVPNADCPTNGARTGEIDIPHTYYFRSAFFERWFGDVILCGGYDAAHDVGIVERWSEHENPEGRVVRALGRL